MRERAALGRGGVLDNRVTWWWRVENLARLQVRGKQGGAACLWPRAAVLRGARHRHLSLASDGAGGAMLDALRHRAMTYGSDSPPVEITFS